MVARLKLKEIDGRAPPGVNAAPLLLEETRLGRWWTQPPPVAPSAPAICLNCEDVLMLQVPSPCPKGSVTATVGNNPEDHAMDHPQPPSKVSTMKRGPEIR